MTELLQIIVTVFGSVMASSGFWVYIQKRNEKKSALSRMCLGLGHDRIIYLANEYIKRGSITTEEYENLVTYLFEPYEALGGNGTAKRLVDDCKRLPIKN